MSFKYVSNWKIHSVFYLFHFSQLWHLWISIMIILGICKTLRYFGYWRLRGGVVWSLRFGVRSRQHTQKCIVIDNEDDDCDDHEYGGDDDHDDNDDDDEKHTQTFASLLSHVICAIQTPSPPPSPSPSTSKSLPSLPLHYPHHHHNHPM